MKQIDKLRRKINDEFRDRMAAACKTAFPKLEIETSYNILSMALITTPTNQKKFTKEQHTFVRGFSEGYGVAMDQVRDGR